MSLLDFEFRFVGHSWSTCLTAQRDGYPAEADQHDAGGRSADRHKQTKNLILSSAEKTADSNVTRLLAVDLKLDFQSIYISNVHLGQIFSLCSTQAVPLIGGFTVTSPVETALQKQAP